MDALPQVAMVVNQQRQMVFGNRPLMKLLGLSSLQQGLGQRPGELLHCVHADETEGGCGASEACVYCGAVLAIQECQRTHRKAESEARISVGNGKGAASLNVLVTATPFQMGGQTYTVVSMTDISHEKRRRALERIFFHDVFNTAGGVYNAMNLLREMDDPQRAAELLEMAEAGTERLTEEIHSQQTPSMAECGDLSVNPTQVSARQLLENAVKRYRSYAVGWERTIGVDGDSTDVTLQTDPVLLERVLGNMLKNALEATPPGGTVRAGCRLVDDQVEFWVHNPATMPRPVQLQVFQRSFSTKDKGRGPGTYSMRLLSERYLQGRVSFSTDEGDGTIFTARYPLHLTERGSGGR